MRLQGIAASPDLLMGKSDSGGELGLLVRRQLEIFTDCVVDRVELSGPVVQVAPAAVHAFGMVLHELAAKACKYGALSSDSGRVLVTWYLDADKDVLGFEWREIGGPPVAVPHSRGFGTMALQRMLVGALGGSASHELHREGAHFTARIPWECARLNAQPR